MAIARVKTWVSNETLTASDQNAEFDNIIDNFSPVGLQGYSATDTQMRETSNPGGVGTENIPADSLAEELKRLRYVIKNYIVGQSQWYVDPGRTLATGDLGVLEADIGTGAVVEAKIGTGAVTVDKIGAAAVTEAKIGLSAVTNTRINDGAVSYNKLATDSVREIKIQDGAVTGSKLATSSVSESKISTGAVTATKIPDTELGYEKLNPNLYSQGISSSGAILPIDATKAYNVLNIFCTAVGGSLTGAAFANTSDAGAILFVISQYNSTQNFSLTHGTGSTNFFNTSETSITMAPGNAKVYFSDGIKWVQMAI